jgi:hypothetical protein
MVADRCPDVCRTIKGQTNIREGLIAHNDLYRLYRAYRANRVRVRMEQGIANRRSPAETNKANSAILFKMAFCPQ